MYTSTVLAFAGAASAAAIMPRAASDKCCFGINVSGGVSNGGLGQYTDGQNRVGPGYGGAEYCYYGATGSIVDASGRGCVISSPTNQYQCDAGVTAATAANGITIAANNSIEHNGNAVWYECYSTAAQGVYNIYATNPGSMALDCHPIMLTTVNSNCTAASASSSVPAPTSSAKTSTVATTITTTAKATTSTTPKPVSSSTPAPPPPPPATTPKPASSSTPAPPPPPPASTPVAPPPAASTCVASTVTLPAATVTLPASTVTLPAATVTQVVTVMPSCPAPAAPSTPAAPTGPAGGSTSVLTSTVAKTSTVVVPSAPSTPSSPAPVAPAASACPKGLVGQNYEYPHLIVPVNKNSPNTAYGTQYFGSVNGSFSTIFNFDIPASLKGATCSLEFLLPSKKDLVTSDYTMSGSGAIDFQQLAGVATQGTTYANQPKVAKDLGVFPITSGTQTIIASGPCAAGQTVTYELVAQDSTALYYFQDYNPAALGLYIVSC